MKKALLSLLAVVLGLSVMAQTLSVKDKNVTREAANTFVSAPAAHRHAAKDASTPVWHPISQNVTFNDINGNSVSTASIMTSGKAMVIDFFATWCTWCWTMHSNGILEAIHNQLGSQVDVICVEADPNTSSSTLTTGSGNVQGNWTVLYGTSTPLPYPLIDNPSFANIIGGSSVIDGFPTVVFVSPTGYWCDLYGTDWGFGPYDASDAVDAVTALLSSYPQAGELPQVTINAQSVGFVNNPIPFSANIISVDAINSINWTFPDADIVSGTGETPASPTWSTAGTYTVTCAVNNTTGTTTETHDITIRDGWSWGDVMDYTDGGTYESAIGLSSGNELEWGVLYPADVMTGRNYVTQVSAYINDDYTGTYTLRIYQGGTTAPQTLIYENAFNVTLSGQWVDFDLPGGVAIDPTQSMWVTLSASGYAATYTTYDQDPNSSMISVSGNWHTLSEATSGSYEGTWMIKTTTSATAPAFDFILNGPASGAVGSTLTFTINGPSDATYNWTLQGATPATATGTSVSASWANAGTYTITVNGTSATSATNSHTMQVTINGCQITANPYNQGFEETLDDCWIMLDADGDSYTWMQNVRNSTHGGSGNIASASYINGVGAVEPDNWLISPKINLPAESAQISWWDYGDDNNDYAEHYGLYVSTSGTNPSDFTLLWEGDVPSAKTWRQLTQSLNDYCGQGVYIAFRHFNCTNKYWLILDDMKVSGTGALGINDVDQTSVNVYPNPTTGRFHITAEGFENVEVYDVTGRNVMNTDQSVIDLSAFANGVYTLRVNTVMGSSMQKIVKK